MLNTELANGTGLAKETALTREGIESVLRDFQKKWATQFQTWEQGIQKGKCEMVRTALEKGADVALLTQITDFSEMEIIQIRDGQN